MCRSVIRIPFRQLPKNDDDLIKLDHAATRLFVGGRANMSNNTTISIHLLLFLGHGKFIQRSIKVNGNFFPVSSTISENCLTGDVAVNHAIEADAPKAPVS